MSRVLRKGKRVREKWSREQLDHVEGCAAWGSWADGFPFADEAERRSCWQDVKVKILERFFDRWPGRRPAGWWLFDAPADDVRWVAARIADGPSHVNPDNWYDDPAHDNDGRNDDPPTDRVGEPWLIPEPQIAYLFRNDALWQGEVERFWELGGWDDEYGLLPLSLRPPDVQGRMDWFYRDVEKERRTFEAALDRRLAAHAND